MKIFCLFIGFLIFVSSYSYGQVDTIHTDNQTKKEFKNQGEQEDFWAKELFKKSYSKQKFQSYQGDIKIIDNNIYYDSTLIELFDCDEKLKRILFKGLVYPELLDSKKLRISNIEELTLFDLTPDIKRFRFYIWNDLIIHPTVFFIELTNVHASKDTNIETFIENSELTFIKSGWIIR